MQKNLYTCKIITSIKNLKMAKIYLYIKYTPAADRMQMNSNVEDLIAHVSLAQENKVIE